MNYSLEKARRQNRRVKLGVDYAGLREFSKKMGKWGFKFKPIKEGGYYPPEKK